MYAAESNAPEGRDAQAPVLRGGRAYGPGRNAGAAGRGEAPARRRPPARNHPSRPRSAALELSASCVRAGFPHPGRRGRV